MLDSTADNDDLTPLQEYVIAGVVILLFGLLYWFLNHGHSEDSALMAANTSTPQVVMLAAPQTPVATATAEVNDANVAPDAKKTDSGSATLSAKTAPAPFQTTPSPLPDISATPAAATPKAATLEAGPVGSASANAAATSSIPAAVQPTLYTLPNGSQIDMASSRFGLAFRDAIAKREINKPIVFDEIKFDSGSSKPNNQSSTQIQQVVALLHANPGIKLLIRGHTDEVGTAKDNTELSLIRANEVGVALVQAGIDRKRLRIMGMGSSEPISIDNTDAARERNRRIDALILK
ncbi:OmpA family protein [Thiothrix subterranea]|uniref:OmpA family protein n=1 Tax=Thiothrix subterranea TaxID=2735563 RepID=A0AA51MJA6_9GAMM|nr:OmpA family protein [Thiothrix subterranea]MDQ5767971.1 OmpA family protein [Thiothrix subterranea]WML85263.1 OmpA family protein [Thiothrix subterranea]